MSTQEDNIAWMDATAQAELVQKGEISPIELLEGAIERAEQLNPEINAIINPLYDLAREASKDLPDGPFRGVPFLMKDIGAELAGVKMEEGSRFMRGYVSPEDSELTARFKRAGLNIMGKTNTPEFGLLPTTEPELYGVTRNPWNPELGSGGSSGGACAAVAAGIVPVAHANDGGGSIRIPASACGLVGLKPTRGRNSMAPAGDMANGIVAQHVVSRTVRDSAALLDATHGAMPGDPYFPAPPERPYAQEVRRDPGKLRIAFSSLPLTGVAVTDEVRAALEDTAKLCESLGHTVEEAQPTLDRPRALKAFGRVWVGMLGWAVKSWEKKLGRSATEADFEGVTWRMYQSNQRVSAAEYLAAIEDLQAMSRDIALLFNTFDVWLTPTLCRDPAPLGYFAFTAEARDEHIRRLGQYSGFTSMFNATGQPAMTLPLQWSENGLPLGMQIIGRYADEATLFRLAGQLEQARPWVDRRPMVSA
jgi:amidase